MMNEAPINFAPAVAQRPIGPCAKTTTVSPMRMFADSEPLESRRSDVGERDDLFIPSGNPEYSSLACARSAQADIRPARWVRACLQIASRTMASIPSPWPRCTHCADSNHGIEQQAHDAAQTGQRGHRYCYLQRVIVRQFFDHRSR